MGDRGLVMGWIWGRGGGGSVVGYGLDRGK